jgi:RNA polymerase sigma-70 factor (ECF subfamily)
MVTAFNEGRPQADARLYDCYHPVVTMRVTQLIGNSAEATRLVGKIFVKMLGHQRKFETVRSIENYLGRLITTMCRDELKLRRRRIMKMDEVQEYYQRIEDRAQRQAEIKSTAKAVHNLAMEMLPPGCKEIYILSFIRDMRNKEIAERLGLSPKTVENQINIALNKLRREFNRNGGRMYFIKYLLPLLWDQLASL